MSYQWNHSVVDSEVDTQPEQMLLILHRGRVFEELLEAFQQSAFKIESVKIEMRLPNGEVEAAEDMGGVLRDSLSEFWQTFYEKCTLGTNVKVPYLRHDFGEPQWVAIGKILAVGWKNEQYFPIKLASTFIHACLEIITEDEDLIKDFLLFVSDSESDVLKAALNNFDTVDYDELLEVVSFFDSKRMPTKDNIRQLLMEFAHKDLVQKAAFVARCFKNNLFGVLVPNDLRKIYGEMEPTPKNILAKLICESDLREATRIYGFLKKFIRESDANIRSAFLRFCTGSDIANRFIRVTVFNDSGSTNFRCPTAHTCAGLLEMPTSYENYLNFRSELKNILSANVWVMDII